MPRPKKEGEGRKQIHPYLPVSRVHWLLEKCQNDSLNLNKQISQGDVIEQALEQVFGPSHPVPVKDENQLELGSEHGV